MERLTVRSHPKHSVPLVTAGGADVLLPNRRMLKRLIAITALALLLPLQTLAQSHSAFPIDISAGPAPRPVMADRSTRLVYELHLTNFSANPIELLALDVFGDDRSTPLASYQGEGLEKLLVAVGPTDSVGRVRAIGGGRSVVIFLSTHLERKPIGGRSRLSMARLGSPSASQSTGYALEPMDACSTSIRSPTPTSTAMGRRSWRWRTDGFLT